MGKVDSDTLYGTLNLLVLGALEDGTLHGLAIARKIREEAKEVLSVEEGALYPALHRLERDGLVEGSWGISGTRRRAKFYDLTKAGRSALQRERARWVRHTSAVASVLRLGWERPE